MDNTGVAEPGNARMDDYPIDTYYTPTDHRTLLLAYSRDVFMLRVMHLARLPSILPPKEITRILNGLDITRRCRVLWPLNYGKSTIKLHMGWCHVIFSSSDAAKKAVGMFNGKRLGRSIIKASIAVADIVSTAKHPLCYQKFNYLTAQDSLRSLTL